MTQMRGSIAVVIYILPAHKGRAFRANLFNREIEDIRRCPANLSVISVLRCASAFHLHAYTLPSCGYHYAGH